MNFIADLHIHSRFSRATSKQLSPRHLAAWARCKGINVLGTGDFTHPQWRDELRRQLVRDEASGLYRLSGPAEELDFLQGKTPPDADGPLFLLQTEISSIYKRQGKVRKVHNLIFVPTLDDADRLSQRLELVGNLHSDGRPILGLDSRDLLEMTLDVCPEAVLIPAASPPIITYVIISSLHEFIMPYENKQCLGLRRVMLPPQPSCQLCPARGLSTSRRGPPPR